MIIKIMRKGHVKACISICDNTPMEVKFKNNRLIFNVCYEASMIDLEIRKRDVIYVESEDDYIIKSGIDLRNMQDAIELIKYIKKINRRAL